MKKFFLALLLLPVSAWAGTRTVTISAPSQVTAGQSFTVPTSASTDFGGGEQLGFYHAQYSTDGGATWTWFAGDVNAGTSATRNAYITAGAAGSTIIVKVKIAFRGGSAGDVDYNGTAINWSGSWDAGAAPPAKVATISVVAPPNQAPTVTWIQNPGSAYVNQNFAIQARGNDADGNLAWVHVWKEWTPFAFNQASNGYEWYSDANVTNSATTGTINFQAQSGDYASATSSTITHAISIVKMSQTITFNQPAAQTYGTPLTLGATASSGLGVTYSIVSGPATVSGSTVTFTGTGNVTVRASQAGDGTYNAAADVDRTFAVNPASQTITFNQPATQTYGTPLTLSATASSGLAVTYGIISGPATVSGSTVTFTGAGSVTVRASQAGNANYSAATDVDRTFTVNTASQTITFTQPANKTYGNSPFTLSATASSGLTVSFSIMSGPATVSGSTLTITGAGTVVVRASQAGNGSYGAAANVDRTFTVSKASQTITFTQPANKTYGNSPFALSASASSGLAITFSIVSGPATVSGSTLTITGAGTVVVRAAQAGNSNYNAATNADRTFTVAKASQTITFAQPGAQTYGTPLTLSATSTSGLTVAFSVVSGPATLSGNTLTFTGNGNVTVRAAQAGNTNYNAATNVDRTFAVTGAPVPPTVSITVPTNNASYSIPASFTLTATAADSDGTVSKVEFFQNGVKIGESTASPYTLAVSLPSSGTYAYVARATDNGNNTTDSTTVTITTGNATPTIPFLAGFEASEGYALAALNNQNGWTAGSGVVVTNADYSAGAASALIPTNTPALQLSRTFPTHASDPVVFVDLFLLPQAGADTSSSVILATAGAAQVAFVKNGATGQFQVFNGNGSGGGAWQATTKTVALDAQDYAADWVRLTLRLDYTAHKWDLSVDGVLTASDVPFVQSAQNTLGSFTLTGRTAGTTMFDDFLAGFTNPMFTDADKDGMPDSWETAVGLNPAVNDRNGDLDSDGVDNITEYRLGTNPANANPNADTDGDGLTDAQEAALGTKYYAADTDGDGLPDGWEQAHGLNPLSAADAALDPDGDGRTNAQEYAAGGDPQNRLDAFALPGTPANLQLILPVPGNTFSGLNTSWDIVPVSNP